jgi:ubiquinone/menaquinone biosynthesis C-methylase UbiE
MHIAKSILFMTAIVVGALYLINQCRKPRGWLGRFFLWEMGGRHVDVTDWGLGHINIEARDTVLDVGCGGGRTVSKLATIISEGKVYGIDYSKASVAAAHRRNQQMISEGRVEIHLGSVSQLPFSDAMFDVVTAVETHYYWPHLVADLREIMRTLKPDGQLVIIAEAYKRTNYDPTQAAMKLLRAAYLSASEHRAIFEESRKGWICAMGRKPDALFDQ